MRIVLRAILFTVFAHLTSCAAPSPTASDPLEIAPADFYIDATILVAPSSRSVEAVAAVRRAPSWLWPGRFVLFADGTLRQGFDATGEKGANWLPPISRMLTHEQTAQVWSMAQQLGLANPDAGDPIINPSLVKASPGERVVYVDVRGNGQRWNFLRRAALDQPPDAALAQLIRHLAQLAWAEEEPVSETFILPRRYDFGPDPYERYRKPSPTP